MPVFSYVNYFLKTSDKTAGENANVEDLNKANPIKVQRVCDVDFAKTKNPISLTYRGIIIVFVPRTGFEPVSPP